MGKFDCEEVPLQTYQYIKTMGGSNTNTTYSVSQPYRVVATAFALSLLKTRTVARTSPCLHTQTTITFTSVQCDVLGGVH